MKASIVNTATALTPQCHQLINGTFKSALPESIPMFGSKILNHGWDVVPDANGAINATMLYRDTSPNGTRAYAVIKMFAKSPLPGMFGGD